MNTQNAACSLFLYNLALDALENLTPNWTKDPGLESLLKDLSCIEHPDDLDEPSQILVDAKSPNQPDDLGTIYESSLSENKLKKSGIVYTPKETANRIVKTSVKDYQEKKSGALRFLDPSCGSGIFLLSAFRELYRTRQDQTPLSVLQRHVYGVDRDPLAAFLARITLCIEVGILTDCEVPLEAVWRVCCANIKVGNALIDPVDIDKPEDAKQIEDAFSWADAFPHVLSEGGFSVIAGNPPYGLSRGEQISKEEKRILHKRYAEYRRGKVNKYLLFIAKSYELLRDRGVLSFIVPNAWLGIRSAGPIRELLLTKTQLKEIVYYQTPIFNDRSVEPVSFRAIKGTPADEIQIIKKDSDKTSTKEVANIPFSICIEHPDKQIPLIYDEDAAAALKHIESASVRLFEESTEFRSFIALQAYARGKGKPPQSITDVKEHIYHSDKKNGEEYFPYLNGSDVDRYSISWSGKWLSHGPWLAEPQKIDRFSGPRILVREILSPAPYLIKASYTEDTSLYNKSILHILPKDGESEVSLLALLAVLNSKLASFIIKLRGKKSQRKVFPKLVNDDLLLFPVSAQLNAWAEALSERAKESIRCPKARVNGLQAEIDELVFKSYGLSDRHQEAIERTLQAA